MPVAVRLSGVVVSPVVVVGSPSSVGCSTAAIWLSSSSRIDTVPVTSKSMSTSLLCGLWWRTVPRAPGRSVVCGSLMAISWMRWPGW
jgi:hypothetical protein